jgi:hypothetical protein
MYQLCVDLSGGTVCSWAIRWRWALCDYVSISVVVGVGFPLAQAHYQHRSLKGEHLWGGFELAVVIFSTIC